MNLQFNHDSLKTVDNRDLMNFISYILGVDSYYTKDRIYVNTSYLEAVNESNCRVVIKFQCWEEKQSGEGIVRYWVCNRANNFCCSQQQVQSFQPMPLDLQQNVTMKNKD